MDRYEEALEKARVEYEKARKQGYTWLMNLLEGMFPEMKESEDERIRNGIVKLLTVASEEYLVDSTGIKKASYLTYLERLKEQKSVEWSSEDERLFDSTIPNLI